MERQYHLQTYFWALSGDGLRGEFFYYFWHRYYKFYSRRQTVIDRYELQLAFMAQKHFGLKAGAYYEVIDIVESVLPLANKQNIPPLCKLNPTQHLWQELLTIAGLPLIKRELLQKDPLKLDAFTPISHLLKKANPILWGLITDHLAKIRQ
jgi:lipopolysaccharide biosynthesis protein